MTVRHIKVLESDPPDRLLNLTHQQFYNFVDQDVRSRLDDAVAAKLRNPIVVDRWYLVLVQMKKNVESQLASAKADWRAELFEILGEIENAPTLEATQELRAEQFEKQAEYESSRAKKLRFRSAVEDSLTEARILHNRLLESRASSQLARTRAQAEHFRTAIEIHRSTLSTKSDNVDANDELWAQLEGTA